MGDQDRHQKEPSKKKKDIILIGHRWTVVLTMTSGRRMRAIIGQHALKTCIETIKRYKKDESLFPEE